MTEREVSSERLPDRCPHCDLHWGYNPPAMIAGTDNVRCIECKTVFVKFPVSSERVSEERLERILDDARRKFLAADSQVMCRYWQDRIDIYTELLALRSSVKTVVEFTLDEEELDTILAVGRNEQSGRITNYELKELVRVYRAALEAPTTQEAPIEVTDAMVDAAHAVIERSYQNESWEFGPPSLLARSALTAALKGDRP